MTSSLATAVVGLALASTLIGCGHRAGEGSQPSPRGVVEQGDEEVGKGALVLDEGVEQNEVGDGADVEIEVEQLEAELDELDRLLGETEDLVDEGLPSTG
ncbi:MAG: hypothetical protein ACFCVK_09550 [Acidimicrobiales bacterium]